MTDPDDEDRMDENTIWYRTDPNSNGRWLYVDHPDRDGDIPVGILWVYEKQLTPAEARAMAAALLQAADESDADAPERERRRRAERPAFTTSGSVATLWAGTRRRTEGGG